MAHQTSPCTFLKRLCFCAAIVACSTFSQAQTRVTRLNGKYCAAAPPQGWTVSAENPAGVAFGADLRREDGAAVASYLIFGVTPGLRQSPFYQQWYATPERAVFGQLTQFGTKPVSCSRPTELVRGSGYMVMACQEQRLRGEVVYKVFPGGDNGYVVLMRTAASPHAAWDRYGAEAITVARSLVCNVPLMPRSRGGESDMPKSPRGKKGEEGDSGYSPWLGMENYHDPATGENYWVSPSRDWSETGSQGAGYYAKIGNDVRKLVPGVSQ